MSGIYGIRCVVSRFVERSENKQCVGRDQQKLLVEAQKMVPEAQKLLGNAVVELRDLVVRLVLLEVVKIGCAHSKMVCRSTPERTLLSRRTRT